MARAHEELFRDADRSAVPTLSRCACARPQFVRLPPRQPPSRPRQQDDERAARWRSCAGAGPHVDASSAPARPRERRLPHAREPRQARAGQRLQRARVHRLRALRTACGHVKRAPEAAVGSGVCRARRVVPRVQTHMRPVTPPHPLQTAQHAAHADGTACGTVHSAQRVFSDADGRPDKTEHSCRVHAEIDTITSTRPVHGAERESTLIRSRLDAFRPAADNKRHTYKSARWRDEIV